MEEQSGDRAGSQGLGVRTCLPPCGPAPISQLLSSAMAASWQEPQAESTVCGIYKQPAIRSPSRSSSHARGPHGEAQRVIWLQQGPAAARHARCPSLARVTGGPGRVLLSVTTATALGRRCSQLPFIPGRGDERGCWNCSFSLFSFLRRDLDKRSLKYLLALFSATGWKRSGYSRASHTSPLSGQRGRGRQGHFACVAPRPPSVAGARAVTSSN